jgi:serine protease Do
MRSYSKKIFSLLLVIALVFSLSSCSVRSIREIISEMQIAEGENSQQNTNNKPNNTQNNQPPQIGTVIENITINGTGDNSIAYAAAKGLRSSVSIYCTFTDTKNAPAKAQSYYTVGSGVIYKIDADGNAFIITNFHLVYDSHNITENNISNEILVCLYGMEAQEYTIPATYVGGSANYDIAVLRVDKNDILRSAYATGSAAAITVGNSDLIFPGQTTIAIGNPSPDDVSGISVTQGIVSVDSEYIVMEAFDNSGEVSFRVIRTDTAVNPGNSGGGLFNSAGELIGIINAKPKLSSIVGVGYAIPSNVVRAIADNIIDYCYGKDCKSVMTGLLGITVTTTALNTNYDTETGLFSKCEEVSVYEVSDGGIAKGILEQGDVIKAITIGNKTVTVTRQYHLIDAMLDVRVGDKVSLTIIRNGVEKTVSTTITEACLAAY